MDVSSSGKTVGLAVSIVLNIVLVGMLVSSKTDAPDVALSANTQASEVEEIVTPEPKADEEAALEETEPEPEVAEADPEPKAEEAPVQLEGTQVTIASIQGSIPQTLAKAAAPYGDFVSATVSRLLVWDHDLRRDLRAGDKLEVAWTTGTSDTVVIEAARFHSQKFNRKTTAYKFKASGDKHPSYWSAEGVELPHRLKKSPMKDYEQITSLLKDRPNHKGMDFKVDVGTPVMASFPGTVTRANWNWKANGNCIEIKHDDGVYAKYLHLSENKVKAGDRVNAGEVIALSGNTGRSTGPHLHYQLNRGARGKVIDPIDYHGATRRKLPEADKAKFADVVKNANAQLESAVATN